MNMGNIISGINWVKVRTYAPMVILAAVILAEIVAAMVFLPRQVFRLLELYDRTKELTASVSQLTDAEKALAAVDDNQLNSLFNRADIALPDEKRVAGVITGLSGLATASGVTVKSIAFSPGRVSTGSGLVSVRGADDLVGDRVRAVKVGLSVTSSLENVLSFISRLQKSVQLLGVTGVSFSLSGTAPGGEMDLLVYYLPTRETEPSLSFVPGISREEVAVIEGLSGPSIFNFPTE